MHKELSDIIKSVKNYIEMEKQSGLKETALSGLFTPLHPTPMPGVTGFTSAPDYTPTMPGGVLYQDRLHELEKIAYEIKKCRECELSKSRRNTVLGEGNPNAQLMFVGEAPGLEEDIQGRPFVGKAGQLLTKIIEAIGLKREDVYIANSIKCRPPKNRTPLPSEIIACRNYLMRQIDIIKPKIICCLGRPATQALLMTDSPISKVRGKFYNYNGIKLMPTFHPAYLLRNPQDKRLVWQDMQKIRDELKEQ